jgi:phosphatidylethanolamine/phosphatidyl-N-methylethanolamine N-methyltransferase
MFMSEPTTRKIYDVWAHFYDQLASNIVVRRQRLAVPRMKISQGDRVLDIGIGTGLSLETYPAGTHVVGIDISEGMLRHAVRRAKESDLGSVGLAVADAMQLPFADGSFEHVFVSHVITVVSNPVRLIDEIRRVAKPGGRVVIINHFQSGNRLIGAVEKLLCPIFLRVGWKSDLCLEELIRKTGLQVDYRYKLDQMDLWETVFATNDRECPASGYVALA